MRRHPVRPPRMSVMLALALFAATACSGTTVPTAGRILSTPVPTASPTAAPQTVAPTVVPTKPPTPAGGGPRPARRQVLAAPSRPADLSAYTGLGAWIDVFDFDDDPQSIVPAVRRMAELGTRTLYLETARHDSPSDILFPAANAAALEAAHESGMKVVAWYPPDFVDLDRDVRRSLAAVSYVSPGGHRFDGFGADIERTDVKDHADRNARMLEYSRRLREGVTALGSTMPLAAIVIPPTALEQYPGRWRDFPWQAMAAFYELCMPMNYWTGVTRDPGAAAAITADNVRKTSALCGKPVHIIGGLGAHTDEAQAAAYVQASLQHGSIGGGLYDYRTTRDEVWDELRILNGS